MLLDPQRVLAEHLRRERLVDIGRDRLRPKNVSPSPTWPASVWTWTQMMFGNSAS